MWTNAYAYTTQGDAAALSGARPALLHGLGWRFTYASTTTSYTATQAWEIQQVEGVTPSITGAQRSTYGWEWRTYGTGVEEFAVGTIRGITSEDRQYFAVGDNLGGIRALQSSDDAVEILHTVQPDVTLNEEDEPGLLPAAALKYLRYGTLKRALQHPGPGQNVNLAMHYSQRQTQGVKFLMKLANLGFLDRVYVRKGADSEDVSGRLPYVRLPANYPSTW